MADLFANITHKKKEKLLRILEANTINFKKNVSILSSVKWNNLIGIVVSGYIQIIRIDYNGNRTIIEELTENSVFGTSLSSLDNKECDILTKEDSKIIFIEYKEIINQNNREYSFYTQFLINLIEIITKKINEKNERIEILTKKSIRDKLLEYFKITHKKNKSKIIYISNVSELADYLAVDRSALSRELKTLKDEGFIKKEGKKITLLY